MRKSSTWALGILLLSFVVGTASGQDAPAKIKLAEESTPQAVAVYTDAANFQNNSVFELALKDWEKFLKAYPTDPLRPKAEYYLGICALQLKKFARAQQAFQSVVSNFPTFDNREDAFLNLGWSQYQLAQAATEEQAATYQQSADTFAAMLKEFPADKGKRTDQALYFQAEALYHKGDKQGSIAPYTALMTSQPESTLRVDGLYALGVTHEELGQFALAAPVYDLFLKEFPDNALSTEVSMRKAETVLQSGLSLEAEGKAEPAKAAYAEASKLFAAASAVEGFSSADHALYRQALAESKQGAFVASADLYAKIPAQFPQSRYIDEATLSAARTYYQAAKYPESQQWFQKVLDAGGPDASEAAHWISRILIRDNKAAEAAALAAKSIATAAESKYLVNLKMDEADALDRIPESREQAIAKYVAIATAHADHEQASQALYNAAFTALELKKYDIALQHANAFAKAYPDHSLTADVKYVAAESQLLLGKHAEAEALYTELTANYADRTEIEQWRVRLGLSLYLQKKYDEVVATLGPLVAAMKTPESIAETQFLIGASQFYLKKNPEAEAALKASIAAAPKWRQADETLLLLSRSQRAQNKIDEAVATVSLLLKDFPESSFNAQAHYRLGEYSYVKEDYKTAVAEYQTSAKADPKSIFAPYAVYGQGWAHIKAKEFEPGQAAFTSMLESWPDHTLQAATLYARAMCQRQTGAYDMAIADIDAFLKTEPAPREKSNALYEKGLSLVSLKKYPEAVEALAAVLKDDPEYPAVDKVLYELAWAYKTQETEEADAKAVETFALLATKHPDSPLAAEAHFHVGEDLYQQEKFEEAAAQYAQSKAKSKQNELTEKAVYKLGWSNYQQEKYEPALAEFSEQAAKFPTGLLKTDGLFMKAESHFKLKQYKESLAAYTAARAAAADAANIDDAVKVFIYLHGGQSAGQTEDWEGSLAFLTPIITEHPKSRYVSEANFEIGMAHNKLGDAAKAAEFFTTAAAASRDHVGARARFMLGEVYFGEKKYAEAGPEFLRCLFGYGGDSATAEVKKWQAKSAYELGRLNDVQIQGAEGEAKKKAIAEAIKYYQLLVDKFPDDSLVKTAQDRIAQLKKL